MRRNALICVLALGLAYITPTFLNCHSGTAKGDISGQSSTIALGQLLLRDNFDDNQRGSMWRLYNEDPNTCGVVETNGRLEFRSTATSANAFAGYIANTWRLDPKEDFAFRVDAHYDLQTLAGGWINVGIAPSAETPRIRSIELGIGCSGLLPFYWYDHIDEWPIQSARGSRVRNDVVLYVSYTTEDDTLYISDSGYGPEAAWMSFPDVLQGLWAGEPVFVYLGGRSEGLEVGAGQAYLDNLLVEQGLVVQASLQEVYRFWSPLIGGHFYTMNELEKELVLLDFSHVWVYEGVAYYAYPDNSDSACRPVYRFWSDSLSRHFYTISESEKSALFNQNPAVWSYEGVAFYAYPAGSQPDWTLPVYRFCDKSTSAYFYTMDEAEKTRVLNQYGEVFTYEGIVWYASP